MPNYRRHGKILSPITDQDFQDIMHSGIFKHPKHKGFVSLLYYTAVRKMEALRSTKDRFQITERYILFNVGKRLKAKKNPIETAPLNIPLGVPYVREIEDCINHTKHHQRVFPFSPKTAYNICDRIGYYPHFFRLNRITSFFLEGWNIAQVRSWTGLSLRALESYVGIVDVIKMGESLQKQRLSEQRI